MASKLGSGQIINSLENCYYYYYYYYYHYYNNNHNHL